MKIIFYEYFFFLHRKMFKPKGSICIFLVLLKLSEENEMSEVLGSFAADHAALYTAYRNIIPNELSFVFQKGGLFIYFLISTSCFPGGVPPTKYKNHFLICNSSRQHQPRMLDNAGSVSLVFNYSTPRCVLMAHVSSAVFCDSNVDLRGVYPKRIVASVIILMGVFSWRKNISYFVQIYFQLLNPVYFSLHNCQRTRGQALLPLFFFC